MNDLLSYTKKIDCHMWYLEQTKEARFLPSLVQNRVQKGIIFNLESKVASNLLYGDILDEMNISDKEVKKF